MHLCMYAAYMYSYLDCRHRRREQLIDAPSTYPNIAKPCIRRLPSGIGKRRRADSGNRLRLHSQLRVGDVVMRPVVGSRGAGILPWSPRVLPAAYARF